MAGNTSSAASKVSSSLVKLQSLHGMFAIYKKKGPTSADVLNALKEALLKEAGVETPNPRKRKKQWLKMGHGGTLDSAASGVLVVGVGDGTKMLSSMLTGSKKYVAVGELGKATDTLDATGSVVLEKGFGKETVLRFDPSASSYPCLVCAPPPCRTHHQAGRGGEAEVFHWGHHAGSPATSSVEADSTSGAWWMSWAKVTAGSLRPSWWCRLAGSDLCVCLCVRGHTCVCVHVHVCCSSVVLRPREGAGENQAGSVHTAGARPARASVDSGEHPAGTTADTARPEPAEPDAEGGAGP
uniref:tRNA pseudouridine(55) synthase n=1 Tax=Oryzias sinensis TaxID=183150 RepID=A0A8C7Y2P6_9TELE